MAKPNKPALRIAKLPNLTPVKLTVSLEPVSYTHLRAHETKANLVCRLLLEKKNNDRCIIN